MSKATENRRYELADYEKLAEDNHRGLVAMSFQEHAMPYNPGDVAGFKPSEAKKLHDDGTAVPVAASRMKGGHKVEGPVEDSEEVKRLNGIEISSDIMAGHHLPRMQLAKKLRPDATVLNDATAKEIIAAELTRRTGGAVSTHSLATARGATGDAGPSGASAGGLPAEVNS